MGVFVDAPELHLQSQAELEMFYSDRKISTFLSQGDQMRAVLQARGTTPEYFFVRASREWQTSEAMPV